MSIEQKILASEAIVEASIPAPQSAILARHLGCADYAATVQAMRDFTLQRTAQTTDELWLVEHPPVYTLGVAARAQHLPRADNGIPVVKTDRGGQITYHGPGQIVIYLLLDLQRRKLTVRPLVRLMENAVIDLLAGFGVVASGRVDAPGVYAGDAKIAALGLRIRNGRCYHGLALNVDMDLSPFHAIDPCGYAGLAVTQTRDLGIADKVDAVSAKLSGYLETRLRSY
ncbi:MAG: octanoyltransferase [Betaproteobacteria bacterium]|nr:octanoyltransferase [Betaproteobacteria bacterium]